MTDPKSTTTRKNDLGASEIQQKVDQEQAQGFRGAEVDPTPNRNYAVEGVTNGAPTPETDDNAAAAARAAVTGPRKGV